MKKLAWTLLAGLMPLMMVAQTVDDIVKMNVEAKGGIEGFKAIKSFRLEAGPDSGTTAHLSIVVKQPDKIQYHRRIPGKEVKYTVVGDRTWAAIDGDPIRPLTELERVQLLRMTHLEGILPAYRELGFTASLKGDATIDMRATWHINLKGPQDEIDVYVEKENGLERRIVHFLGEEKLSTTVCDWRTVRGLKIAFWLKDATNSSIAIPSADRVRLNETIADVLFEQPAR